MLRICGFALWMALALAPARAGELSELFGGPGTQEETRVDHGAFDKILKTYVAPGRDGINRVDYARLKASPDAAALKAYLAALQQVKASALPPRERMVFFINLYNALTLDVVLSAYPVASIRKINISPGLLSVGPWGKTLVTVEGQALSLDAIEHDILRPVFKDPRVHYAVNCASLGCPNLAARAYTGANLETMLEAAARDFINHRRGVNAEGKRIVLSRIYDWYAKDFTGEDGGLKGHLSRYAKPALKARLAAMDGGFAYDYDWTINDAER